MDNLIKEYRGNLTEEFCKRVIERFERDPRKIEGRTGSGWNTSVKKSTDILITNHLDWKEEDQVFKQSLVEPLGDYYQFAIQKCNQYLGNCIDTGYNIQRTEPGEYYHWHNDASATITEDGVFMRVITFIWYLNDVKEGGGETEFIDGTKIIPETGKLLLFPATWVHAHRGVSPVSEVKYICTGWIHELY